MKNRKLNIIAREWYGLATFDHPSPAPLAFLKTLFPDLLDISYQPSITPPQRGETVSRLHDRVAFALNHIITAVDAESGERDVAILICTHAATLIAIGRTLTGAMPGDSSQEDFLAPTAGITRFVRKQTAPRSEQLGTKDQEHVDWRDGKGVAGGWACVLNGDCDHLKGGAERTWGFKDAED
ncbi:MAG: hypothetical protein Q9220_000849 [cf. Caloplaca sp. 1 TL-2023]